MSSLNSREDYAFVTIPENFVVNGKTLPDRDGDGVDRMEALRAEDRALLMEMAAERTRLTASPVREASIDRALTASPLHDLVESLLADCIPAESNPAGVTDSGAVPEYSAGSFSWGWKTHEITKGNDSELQADSTPIPSTAAHMGNVAPYRINKTTYDAVKVSGELEGDLKSLKDLMDPTIKKVKLDRSWMETALKSVSKLTHAVIPTPKLYLDGTVGLYKDGKGQTSRYEKYDLNVGTPLVPSLGRGDIPHPGTLALWQSVAILAPGTAKNDMFKYKSSGTHTSKTTDHYGGSSSNEYTYGSTHGWVMSGKVYTEFPAIVSKNSIFSAGVESIKCFALVGNCTSSVKRDTESQTPCEGDESWERTVTGSISCGVSVVSTTLTFSKIHDNGYVRMSGQLPDIGVAGNISPPPAVPGTSSSSPGDGGSCRTSTYWSTSEFSDSGSWFIGWLPYAFVTLDPHATL